MSGSTDTGTVGPHTRESAYTGAYHTDIWEKKVRRKLNIKYNLKGMLMNTRSLEGELGMVSGQEDSTLVPGKGSECPVSPGQKAVCSHRT